MNRALPLLRATIPALLSITVSSCATSPAASPAASSSATATAASPAAAVDELLAADRSFSAASAKTDVATGLSAMFASDVRMPAPPGVWVEGAAKATELLRSNADNAGARAEWTPIRGGVSADGQHGFTFGYLTVRRANGTSLPQKYMSYWVKGPGGWRVAAFKRGRRAEGEAPMTLMAPALPPRMIAVVRDPSVLAAFEASLKNAEQAFSDEAQRIGLGPAFMRQGSDDAVNMGPGSTYVVGARQIGLAVGGPEQPATSPVVWNADHVLVAASGDLGITFGTIRSNADPAAPGGPFFTIWRRNRTSDPWRYVAE